MMITLSTGRRDRERDREREAENIMTETERVVKIYAKSMLKVCEILGIIGNDSLLRTFSIKGDQI